MKICFVDGNYQLFLAAQLQLFNMSPNFELNDVIYIYPAGATLVNCDSSHEKWCQTSFSSLHLIDFTKYVNIRMLGHLDGT